MSGDYCFFFNDTATTEIYTLSLHDALPIFIQGGLRTLGWLLPGQLRSSAAPKGGFFPLQQEFLPLDRKSTRLNSSHANISYAVFCLKKKQHTSSSVNTKKYYKQSKYNSTLR